jgi:MFS family permease
MQATTQQIGYLSSLPNFANVLTLLFAPLITEHVKSRKAIMLPFVLIMGLSWLPILLIPYIFQTNQVWWLIGFYTLCIAATGFVIVPWSAMMADLTPAGLRGSYLGLRSRVGGFVTLVASFVAAGLLQVMTGNTRLAFAIIFIAALGGRLLSLLFLSRMSEPRPVLARNTARESIAQITRGLFSTNIGRFIIFIFFLSLAQNIDAPFYSPYLLRELHVSYISYQIINAALAVVTMFVVVWWGKRADKAGRVKVLHVTALMIPFCSLLWLVNSSLLWLCAVQIFTGFAWAGFNLCSGMFIWDAAPQDNRTRFIALFGALGALGITFGSVIGGNVGPHLPKISGSYFLTLFLLAGIVKLIVVLALFRRIYEVRNVQKVKTTELLFGDFQSGAVVKWRRKISGWTRRN